MAGKIFRDKDMRVSKIDSRLIDRLVAAIKPNLHNVVEFQVETWSLERILFQNIQLKLNRRIHDSNIPSWS